MMYEYELAWRRLTAILNKSIEVYEYGDYEEVMNNHEDIKAAYTQIKAIVAKMKEIEKGLGLL